MVDGPSSLGEVVMLGAGSIEHRELIYYTVSKSTTFEPPRAGAWTPSGAGAVGRGCSGTGGARDPTPISPCVSVVFVLATVLEDTQPSKLLLY